MGLNRTELGYQLGLITFIRPLALLRNARSVPKISPRYLGRAAGVVAGGLVGLPLRVAEAARHGSMLRKLELDEPPVFIIGHWRSGTTHLHNLMSHDEQFGCVRMSHALAPDFSLVTRGWLPQLFSRVFPLKRPMDNLTWPMDAPQEEEIPLAKMTPYSWYLQFLFPRDATDMFRRGVLLEGAPERISEELRRKYLHILKVASVHEAGRRLLLKNPVNTARIPMLLELFPDAKFIAIHRSPYEVFPSAINLHRRILEFTSFQKFDEAMIERNVLEIYEQVLHKYFEDRSLIPAGNLVEVAYDDLDQRPLDVIDGIYRDLDLPDHATARPAIEAYVDSQSDYVKNGFVIDDRSAELIEDRWKFAFDKLGYPVGARHGGCNPQHLVCADANRCFS